MVLTGPGLHLPHVLVHTTLFERLMAVTRDGGNLGFLMYLADSAGYLLRRPDVGQKFLPVPDEPLVFFTLLCGWVGVLGCRLARHKGPCGACLGLSHRRLNHHDRSPSSTYAGKLVLFHGPGKALECRSAQWKAPRVPRFW